MSNDDELNAAKIVGSWYWQMAEGHNFRWKNAVKSMVLFYESAPLESDMAQLVIEYLRTRTSVTSLVIAHKNWTFAEPGWNTKDAWYQTVPGEQWAGTESKKVRVYWVLVEAGDGAADGPYTVENGCKYLVTHSYYWDVAAEPQLPQSESGIQYTIQGFTRDRETGLFTYIVEKRETVQQDIELYESAKTIFEDVSEEQHLGVKQDDVASTGLAASVGDGERVERHIEKNPDCTSNIVNRKVKDKKVEEARTVVKKELRGTSAATTDRNLTQAEVAAKTAAEQEVGETRTVEKTDTDLRNLTVEEFTPCDTPKTIGESCERETSVHTDTKVEIVDAASAGPVEQTAEPNKRKTVSYKKNDDGKTADKTTTTQTWTEKTGGGSSNSGNGVVTTTTERKENTLSTPSAAPGVNKVVEIDEQPNDHGSKTTVKRTTVYKPDSKTATGGTTSRQVTVESGVNQVAVPADAPAVNKEVEVSVSLNDHGSMSTQKRVTQYQPDSKTATGGTTSRQVTVESGVNQVAVPADAPAVNKEVEVSVSLNDHGSMSTQKRVTNYQTKSKRARSRLPTEEVETVETINDTSEPISPFGSASLSQNDHGSATTRVTTITPKAISSGWRTWTRTVKTVRGTYTYNCGMIVFRNQQQIPSMPGRHDYHPSVSINQYGLYDGTITYADLANFVEGGEQGGVYGGIQQGSITIDGVSHSTKVFYGYGNEGTEAAVKASQVIVKGVQLPHRTYFTS